HGSGTVYGGYELFLVKDNHLALIRDNRHASERADLAGHTRLAAVIDQEGHHHPDLLGRFDVDMRLQRTVSRRHYNAFNTLDLGQVIYERLIGIYGAHHTACGSSHIWRWHPARRCGNAGQRGTRNYSSSLLV